MALTAVGLSVRRADGNPRSWRSRSPADVSGLRSPACRSQNDIRAPSEVERGVTTPKTIPLAAALPYHSTGQANALHDFPYRPLPALAAGSLRHGGPHGRRARR